MVAVIAVAAVHYPLEQPTTAQRENGLEAADTPPRAWEMVRIFKKQPKDPGHAQ